MSSHSSCVCYTVPPRHTESLLTHFPATSRDLQPIYKIELKGLAPLSFNTRMGSTAGKLNYPPTLWGGQDLDSALLLARCATWCRLATLLEAQLPHRQKENNKACCARLLSEQRDNADVALGLCWGRGVAGGDRCMLEASTPSGIAPPRITESSADNS